MSLSSISHSSASSDFSELPENEQKAHIISWFAGTEFPIEKPEDITDIRMIDDYTVCFWYKDQLRNCPTRERDPRDHISLYEIENYNVSRLVIYIANSAQKCLDFNASNKNELVSL